MKRAFTTLLFTMLVITACSPQSGEGENAASDTASSESAQVLNDSENGAAAADESQAVIEAPAPNPNGEKVWRIHPQWQWNGPNITYYERIGDHSSIVVIDQDGNVVSRFETGPGYAANPSWNELDNEIVYTKAEGGMGGDWNIWKAAADGSSAIQFIDVEDRAMHTAWDPTGAMIAFVQMMDTGAQIVMGNPKTGVTRQITSDEGDRFHPKWLDTSLFLIYDKTLNGQSQICQANVFRREETCMFAVDGQRVSTPAASRNGAIIAFSMREDKEGATSDIWLYQIENESFFQLTDTPDESESAPYWSPDGRWIVFHSDQGGEYNIHRIRTDKTGRRQLTQ